MRAAMLPSALFFKQIRYNYLVIIGNRRVLNVDKKWV